MLPSPLDLSHRMGEGNTFPALPYLSDVVSIMMADTYGNESLLTSAATNFRSAEEGEGGGDGEDVDPDGDDLDFVQGACAAVVGAYPWVGAEQFFEVFQEVKAGEHRDGEQAGEDDADYGIHLHGFTVTAGRNGCHIQMVIFEVCTVKEIR